MQCPKCEYVRQEHDTHVMPGVCPECGIAYEKYLASLQAAAAQKALSEEQLAVQQEPGPTPETRLQRLYYYICFMPSDRDESAFWGHSVLFVIFVVWGWYFIVHGMDYEITGSSFLHKVNLPFHEYGHVMFSPFGNFWMLLGGSLFQILLPLFPLVYFMVWQRDNFAASLMLWWSGENFLDVAPYIADAPIRALPLTTGNDDSHDWWNLLMMNNALDSAAACAWICFLFGVALIATSNAWGAYLLYVEFKGRTQMPAPLVTESDEAGNQSQG